MTSPPPKVDGRQLLARFRRYIRDHGLPMTHQRDVVARAIFFGSGHLSADDIDRALQSQDVHVGKATVYRTLDLLLRAELIDEHDFGDGFKRYEPRGLHQHHEHIICRECGRVVEFTSDRIERMNVLIAEEYGFRHHHHRLEIYGVCRECQERDAAKLESISPNREEED